MNSRLFQEFRAMQLAIKGACSGEGKPSVIVLFLGGIDGIKLGDNAKINEIHLDIDYVNINIFETNSLTPITAFSDEIIEEIIDTMRAKALEISGTDVMVNLKGELSPLQLRG